MSDNPAGADFLALLAPEERDAVRARAGVRRFRAGTNLMHEGQVGTEVMILVSGRVKITYLTHEGREVVLDFRGPGELLGELSVIDGQTRSSTVEAMEPVEALAIAASEFKAMISRSRGSSQRLLENMATVSAMPTASESSSALRRRSAAWQPGWSNWSSATEALTESGSRNRPADHPGGARRLDCLIA